MANLFLKKWLKYACSAIVLLMLFSVEAYASTTKGDLPFNRAIDTFKANFTTWVFGAAVVMWIGTCLMLAFGEFSSGLKQIINILFWLSLAFAAPAGISLLFSTGATF